MWVSLITLKLRPNKPAKIVGLQVGNNCGAPYHKQFICVLLNETDTFSVRVRFPKLPEKKPNNVLQVTPVFLAGCCSFVPIVY